MSPFSKNLRYLRKKGSLNQEEISNLFNKRANTIGNWENGKSEPSLTELIKLGAYFNVSLQALLNADLEKEPGPESGGLHEQGSVISRPVSNPLQESAPGRLQEGNPDTFWLILRELRAMNEKLDLLKAALPFSGSALNSDKSSH
jgi:transcriptional regulator with XRE-family HTH domain